MTHRIPTIPFVKSSAAIFIVLVALVAIIGCGDGITGQVVGVEESTPPAPDTVPSATFVSQWGEYGSSDGLLSSPEDVAVAPDGSVYVSDTETNRILKFSSDGTFVTE